MTRRPLLWGALGGLAAMLVLAPAVGAAMSRLIGKLHSVATARVVAAAPPMPRGVVDDAIAMPAPNRPAANVALAARVRQIAAQGAVLVEETTALEDGGDLARVRVRLSGSEDAVIALIDALERSRPLVRFARWRIDAAPAGAVRLQGELVAPWR